MGLIERSDSQATQIPNTEIEATLSLAGRSYNVIEILNTLSIPDSVPVTDISSTKSLREYVFSQKGNKEVHVAIIFDPDNPEKGIILPKRPLLIQGRKKPYRKFKDQDISIKVEQPPVPFNGQAEKTSGLIQVFTQMRADDPSAHVESEQFVKYRSKRYYRNQNGLLIEASGDTVVFPKLVRQKIELELAAPAVPNPESLEFLRHAKRSTEAQLSEQDISFRSRKRSNSNTALLILAARARAADSEAPKVGKVVIFSTPPIRKAA